MVTVRRMLSLKPQCDLPEIPNSSTPPTFLKLGASLATSLAFWNAGVGRALETSLRHQAGDLNPAPCTLNPEP